MLQFGFVRVVTTISRRGIDRCRNNLDDVSTGVEISRRRIDKCRSVELYLRRVMPSFLYVLEELCASLRIVGKRESKDPEFQKEYLKLVDEEPTAVIPDEIESVVKENFRAILKSSRYSKISTRQLLCRLV